MMTAELSRKEAIDQAAAKHHGLSLLPPPTDYESDPLRWPRPLKVAALVATAFCNFSANFAGAGLSVATEVLQIQFQKTPSQVNALLTFNFLLLGVGNIFWVPLGVKFGKRPVLLLSTAMLFAVLIWTAKAQTFNQLLAARCLSGFASAAGESIVPGVVADIFFLHERASMMSGYTILISGATAVGPLIASFMLQYSTRGWVDFVWVCSALAGVNFLAIYFLYPESNFDRPRFSFEATTVSIAEQTNGSDAEKSEVFRTETLSRHQVNVVSKSWLEIWRTFLTINQKINVLEAFWLPFKMVVKPKVILAVFIYGTSLAAQIILTYAFPSLLFAPPYRFSSIGVGLMQVAAIIGFVVATFVGGYVADVITAAVIRKQSGLIYPEQRLISLIPGFWVGPVGCIILAFACSEKLHWVAIAFGYGMVSFGTVFAPNITITYVVESYPRLAPEALVAINVFKNLVAFLFMYTAVDWVSTQGWLQVYMIMFMTVALGMILAVPFYLFRKK